MTSMASNNVMSAQAGRYGWLKQETAQLGMLMSVWTADGDCVDRHTPNEGLWPYVAGKAPADSDLQAFAARITDDGAPATDQAACGAVLLGVPIYERRRLLAVMVAAYWPQEILAGEALHRVCDQVGVDHRMARMLGEASFRHSLNQAKDFLWVLDRAAQMDSALCVATQDLDELSLNLTTTYEELALVYRVSGTMKLTEDPNRFLHEEVCQGLLDVLDVGAVVAFVHAHPPVSDQDEVLVAGHWPLSQDQTAKLVGRVMPRLKGSTRGLIQNRLVEDHPDLAELGLEHLAAVALPGDEKPIGVLIAVNKRSGEFDSIDGKLIRAVASEAGVFLTNHRLFADVQELLIGVLDALTASIDAKDPYTCGHSRRVAVLSRRLAEAIGMPRKRAERVYLAGLLHDIGKIGVPERILRKPGKLSDAEFGVIQKHPEISAKILSGIRQLEDVVPGIRHHHERMDGKGYPDGLVGDAIPLEGRIIGLADCFDALTSNRVYRKAMPISTVTDVIESNAGTQFDAKLAEALLSMDLEGFINEFREEIEATSQLADDLEDVS